MQSASATARRSGALQLAWERAKCADSTAVSFVAEHRRHRCDLASRLVCSCGRGGILWAGIAAAAAARTRGTTAAVTAAGTVATAFAASAALARLLGRRRPFEQAG